MEDQSSSMFELQIDEFAQNSLRETTKWTRFLAIVFYVCMGLMAFALFAMFLFKDTMTKAFEQSPRFSQLDFGTGMILTVVGLMIVVGLVVFVVVTYALMRFSTQTRKGVDHQNQAALESGISSLKNYMIITGILGIIGIFFSLLQLTTLF